MKNVMYIVASILMLCVAGCKATSKVVGEPFVIPYDMMHNGGVATIHSRSGKDLIGYEQDLFTVVAVIPPGANIQVETHAVGGPGVLNATGFAEGALSSALLRPQYRNSERTEVNGGSPSIGPVQGATIAPDAVTNTIAANAGGAVLGDNVGSSRNDVDTKTSSDSHPNVTNNTSSRSDGMKVDKGGIVANASNKNGDLTSNNTSGSSSTADQRGGDTTVRNSAAANPVTNSGAVAGASNANNNSNSARAAAEAAARARQEQEAKARGGNGTGYGGQSSSGAEISGR